MKVLLVQPWLGRSQHPVQPLGLAVLASGLKGHQVRIIDLNLFSDPVEALEGEMIRFKPDATGFSLRNCDTTSYHDPFSYIPSFRKQIELARALTPSGMLVVGGAGFSIFPAEVMELCPQLNCGVTGHGEGNIEEIIRNRVSGVVSGESSPFLHPEFHLLDLESYLPFQRNLATGVEVNRGCSENCRYCSYPSISGNTVWERPLDEIADDVVALLNSGCSHFFFIAPVLNSTRRRGMAVAGMAAGIPGTFTWESYHSPEGFNRDYATILVESGCTAVSFSPDGGTAEQLKLMGKKYTVSQVEQAVDAAGSLGIDVSLNLFPWHRETGVAGMMKGFKNGYRWGKKAGTNLRRLRFSLIRRMPGTPYSEPHLALSEQIPPNQFVKPPPVVMTGFLALKKLFERSRTQ